MHKFLASVLWNWCLFLKILTLCFWFMTGIRESINLHNKVLPIHVLMPLFTANLPLTRPLVCAIFMAFNKARGFLYDGLFVVNHINSRSINKRLVYNHCDKTGVSLTVFMKHWGPLYCLHIKCYHKNQHNPF